MLVRFHACPHCGSFYKMTLSRKPSMIGQGTRVCRSCGKTFSDKTKEWVQMTTLEKFHALVPIFYKLMLFIWTLVIITGISAGESKDLPGVLIILSCLSLVFWSPFFLLQCIAIKKSLQRTEINNPI